MAKKNRFSKCYGFFTMIAVKKMWPVADPHSSGMRLAVMIVKEQLKKEFGIKSLTELNKKKLKEFERFLANKL